MRARSRRLLSVICILVLALLAPAVLVGGAPTAAYASAPSFVKAKKGTYANVAPALTAKEKRAYRRALNACLDYERQPQTITVDVSDLKLTNAQALHVGYALHSNGEVFWVNTYNDDYFTKKRFILPCTYDDTTITSMRKKLDSAVSKALARLGTGMDGATKIHTLHDYVISKVDYADRHKTAYDALVLHKGDCFGFTQAMDLLLRRAGFTTDVAYNLAGSHSWNLVRVAGSWYHVDVTWDNGFTGQNPWRSQTCHLYLLQPDSHMRSDGYTSGVRGRWWSHHTCTSRAYRGAADVGETFSRECKTYKLYVSGFVADGLRYKVCGAKKVTLAGVASTARRGLAKLNVPAAVTRKGVTYKVVGLDASAFSKAKARIVVLATGNLTPARTKACLAGSKVRKIKLTGSAVARRTRYQKCFAERNCGAKVKLV